MLRKLRKHLTENADYVGDRFAEEARRIHYDEVEKRGIYGEATSDEVRSLAEEGIEFHPLPVLPEDPTEPSGGSPRPVRAPESLAPSDIQ